MGDDPSMNQLFKAQEWFAHSGMYSHYAHPHADGRCTRGCRASRTVSIAVLLFAVVAGIMLEPSSMHHSVLMTMSFFQGREKPSILKELAILRRLYGSARCTPGHERLRVVAEQARWSESHELK